MPFDLFIFDFDGTLVDSAELKRAAFFELFGGDAAAQGIVHAVLAEDPEGSRERVISAMLQRMGFAGSDLDSQVRSLVNRYTDRTDQAVGDAPELPGATKLLAELHRAGKLVYVSSNTPEPVLNRFLQLRGWLPYLNGMAGYPALKGFTARRLLAEHGIAPSRAVVIGDGESDRVAAQEIGAHFCPVGATGDLQRLAVSWGIHA